MTPREHAVFQRAQALLWHATGRPAAECAVADGYARDAERGLTWSERAAVQREATTQAEAWIDEAAAGARRVPAAWGAARWGRRGWTTYGNRRAS